MSFSQDLADAIDNLGHGAGKHSGDAAANTATHLNTLSQEAGRHMSQTLAKEMPDLDAFGEEAGKHIGQAAANAGTHLDSFGHEAGKHVGIATVETRKHLDNFGQKAGAHIGQGASNAREWVEQHPGETAAISGCVLAAPIAIAITPLILGAVGFTAGGIAAGSTAAAAQAGIGNVAAGSIFAVLQSAGAGGAGLAIVNGIVSVSATAVAIVGAATPRIFRTIRGKQEEDERTAESSEKHPENADDSIDAEHKSDRDDHIVNEPLKHLDYKLPHDVNHIPIQEGDIYNERKGKGGGQETK